MSVFRRASSRCDEKKLLLALAGPTSWVLPFVAAAWCLHQARECYVARLVAGIYERTDQPQLAEKTHSAACKKFRGSAKVEFPTLCTGARRDCGLCAG